MRQYNLVELLAQVNKMTSEELALLHLLLGRPAPEVGALVADYKELMCRYNDEVALRAKAERELAEEKAKAPAAEEAHKVEERYREKRLCELLELSAGIRTIWYIVEDNHTTKINGIKDLRRLLDCSLVDAKEIFEAVDDILGRTKLCDVHLVRREIAKAIVRRHVWANDLF